MVLSAVDQLADTRDVGTSDEPRQWRGKRMTDEMVDMERLDILSEIGARHAPKFHGAHPCPSGGCCSCGAIGGCDAGIAMMELTRSETALAASQASEADLRAELAAANRVMEQQAVEQHDERLIGQVLVSELLRERTEIVKQRDEARAQLAASAEREREIDTGLEDVEASLKRHMMKYADWEGCLSAALDVVCNLRAASASRQRLTPRRMADHEPVRRCWRPCSSR